VYTVRVEFQRTPRSRRPPRYPNRIREYRIKNGLSQRGLADDLDRPLSMISVWERGRSLPNLQNLFRLSKALNTFAEALYPSLYVPRDRKP
jgi:transcriptional regulator with XRE-family HTH domain